MVYARQLVQYAPYAGKAAVLGTMPWLGSKKAVRNGYSRTITTTQSKRRSNGVSTARKMMLATLPSKQMSAQLTPGLTHGSLLTLDLTSMIVQGTNNQQRLGDQVTLLALKLNGSYFTAATAGAYRFRILVGYSGEEYPNNTFVSGLGASEIFLPSTFSTFVTCGIVNPRAFRVLHDQSFDVNSQIAAVVDICSFAETVSLNSSKFDYQASASSVGKLKNLYCVIVADVGGGTSGVTSTGSLIMSIDTIFK